MMWLIGALLVALSVATVGTQQAGPVPALNTEEALLVEAVMALQRSASSACDALPAVKQYTDLLAKTNAVLTKAGKAVDWRTGAAMAPQKAGQ